jgi:hypothetical protein
MSVRLKSHLQRPDSPLRILLHPHNKQEVDISAERAAAR